MKPKTIEQYQKEIEELKGFLSCLVDETSVHPPLSENGWYEIKTSIHPRQFARIKHILQQ